MRYSMVHLACICALFVSPVWSTVGCGGDADDGDGGSAGSGGSAGTGGSGGATGGSGGGAAQLPLEQQVVGAWGASGMCQGNEILIGQFICPGGRIRGVETFNDLEFLVCGTWTSQEPSSVSSDVQLISVQDPSDPANEDLNPQNYTYDRANDVLTLEIACDIPLERLEGGVDANDCESVTCTNGGGSGPVSCGTDCECGRCWFCESGICRYGGEGEFGCFRGCGEFVL